MRIDNHGTEIELHDIQRGWLWVLFDEDGEQIGSGERPDCRSALMAARRAADGRYGVVRAGVRYLKTAIQRRAAARAAS